jgi:OPT oligopeptide transporter protein
MNSIVDNQREILLSVQGTNIWSGQQPQQYNSQAIAWGGLRCDLFFSIPTFKFVDDHPYYSHELFSIGKRYQFVAWAYLIGLMVPVPFWAMYKLWPKLRTDYFYTPVIWHVEHMFFPSSSHY